MELTAIHSLRCKWNAIWYSRGDFWVFVKDLRPGAHGNPNCEFPKVRIDCELNLPVIMAETFKGDMFSKLVAGSDGKGGVWVSKITPFT